MEEFSPIIIEEELTRNVEERMEEILNSKDGFEDKENTDYDSKTKSSHSCRKNPTSQSCHKTPNFHKYLLKTSNSDLDRICNLSEIYGICISR